MGSEAGTWGRLREGLRAAADGKIDISRVENLVESGMPDVNFCYEGAEGWLELKHAHRVPVRDNTPAFAGGGLRDAQILWIHKRVKRGGRVFIFCQIGEGLFLIPGACGRVFNKLSYMELIEQSRWWHEGNRPDWKELLGVISK